MTAPAPDPRRLAWAIMLLLFLGSVANYIDRAALGVLMPQVRRDLALSNTDYSLVVNAFLVFYTLFYVLGGRLADRAGARRTFSLTVLVWSLAAMGHALAAGFLSLAFLRALLGAGQGGFYPAAIRASAQWFRPQERAKAIGLLLAAICVGTLITPPLVAFLTLHWGWRAAFFLTGALGLPLLYPWIALHARVHRLHGSPDATPAPAASAALPLRRTLLARKYLCLLAGRSCSDAAWYFYLFWAPGYFQEVRGLSLAVVGQLLWIPFLAAGFGALGGAWLSSRLIASGWTIDGARKLVLLVAAALAAAGASLFAAPTTALALALLSLALFGHLAWSTNIHTAITEVTPPAHVAVLYGVTGAAGTLAGVLLQTVVGPLVDALGYPPAFVIAGSLYVVAASLLLAAGRIEPIT